MAAKVGWRDYSKIKPSAKLNRQEKPVKQRRHQGSPNGDERLESTFPVKRARSKRDPGKTDARDARRKETPGGSQEGEEDEQGVEIERAGDRSSTGA